MLPWVPTPHRVHSRIRRDPLRHLPGIPPELPVPGRTASVAQRDRLVERVDLTLGGRIGRSGVLGGSDAHLLEDLFVDLAQQLGVVDEEALRVLPSLAELLTLVGEPRTGLLDEPEVDADVEQRALAADP